MSKIIFKTIKTIDFCDDVRDGTHDSPKHLDSGRILITSKNIKGDSIDFEHVSFISEEDYNKINERSLVEKNDILYSMIGTVGLVYRVEREPNYAIKNMGLFKISDEVKSKWLYYYLKSPEAIGEVTSKLGGSTQKFISLSNLRNLNVKYPEDSNNAYKIIKILDSIEEKIRLNNKTNNNLYEICNSIYHSFLDKYSNLIIDTKLVNIAKRVITGKTPSTKNEEFWNGNIPFITIPDMHNQVFTINTERTISKLGAKAIIPKNSISVSCIATVGLVSITIEESQTNQQVNSIVINNDYDLYYLFEFLSEQTEYLKAIAGGSTTYNINKKTFENIVIPYLPEELLKKFNEQVSCLFERIKENQIENKNLEQLRDTLLPKLMNGEIDLDNVEI